MTTMHRALNQPARQNEKATASQVKNNAGGYVFKLDPIAQMRRFLILGTEGGTYYQKEREITREAIQLVEAIVIDPNVEPRELVELIIECGNNAPKRTYALWALAQCLATGSNEHKALVQSRLPDLVKTGTDLFEFVSYVERLRGWGPAARKAVSHLIMSTPVDKLGLWSVKYRDRHGFTWKDVLRLSHARSKDDEDPRRSKLFDFMLGKNAITDISPVDGYLYATGRRTLDTPVNDDVVPGLIKSFGLPWEALTDEQRTDDVWKACLPFIGEQAVLRNLASFTRRGMDADDVFRSAVLQRLVTASKLHPLKVLDALKTYGSGGAVGRSKGGAYSPRGPWIDALEATLERSFTDGIRATNQRVYVGLDVSGSMSSAVSGSAVLSCAEAGAAIALAVAKNEPDYQIFGFCATSGYHSGTGMKELGITRTTSFKDACKHAHDNNFGRTDCALPMLHAAAMKWSIDTFIVITDNETWSGQIHPYQALRDYRKQSGLPAKLAVIGMTSTGFSIADPTDQGMMDFVGFSADLPSALESFMRL